MKYGTWSSYTGTDALILAAFLLTVAAVLAVLGMRLHRRLGVDRPGKFIASMIVVMWLLSVVSFLVAAITYVQALIQQVGEFTVPRSPILPITVLSGLVTFVVIVMLTWRYGVKEALLSAVAGIIAASMVFELPFDLIVVGKTYPPDPALQYSLLYFLPLFVVGIGSYAMLSF